MGYSNALLTTVARVQQQPNMATITNTDFIEAVLKAVSQSARVYCRREFTKQTDRVDVLSGDGTNTLVLPTLPAISIAKVEVYLGGGWQEVHASNWFLDAGAGWIELLGRADDGQQAWTFFPRDARNVRVTWTSGFDPIPDAVQQGVAVWASEVCLKLTRDPSLASETLSKYSWTAVTAAASTLGQQLEPPDAAKIFLAPYRDVHV